MEKQTRRTLSFKIPFNHLANMGHDLHQVWVKKTDVKPDRKPSMAIASTPKTTSYPSVTSHPSPAAWLNETLCLLWTEVLLCAANLWSHMHESLTIFLKSGKILKRHWVNCENYALLLQ